MEFVTPDQLERVGEAEANERLNKAVADSMGRSWPWPPIDYGFFLDAQQLQDPHVAYAELLNTRTFASGHVGMGGERSEQYIAFNTLLESTDAIRAFRSLLSRAHLAGQLYALCGLYIQDPAYFDTVIREYEASKDSVWTLWGDVVDRHAVAVIVNNPHAIRLEDRQSLSQWYEQNYGDGWERLEPAGVFKFDIVGGAWPDDLTRRVF